MSQFIAVDWGTTNRRSMLIDDGRIAAIVCDAYGVATMAKDAFPSEVAALRKRLGDLPVLMAGMVGASIGWLEAPYVQMPAGITDLADASLRIDARTWILPGVSRNDGIRADVMRGEEVQVLGAIAAGLSASNGLFVQPGTHCKWVTAADGNIVDLVTSMTGELFALLRNHSVLATQVAGVSSADASFLAGVERARSGDLGAALFGIRASALLGAGNGEGASYLSGLLIGADVTARVAHDDADQINLIADDRLGALYAAAIAQHGRMAIRIDSAAAFVAGIEHLKDLIL